MKQKIGFWIEAMRLRTLPVSLAGVICACGFTLHEDKFKLLPALICIVFAALCQIASNFANEYFDYKAGRDRSGREGPRRGVTEGEISPSAMKWAVFGVLAAAAALGMTLVHWGGWWLVACGVTIAIGAMAYSAGPYPFSTHCLGEASVIFFFGIVPVNLTYYVQSAEWSHDVFMTSVAMGLMGANVLIINNTRDIPDDRAVGKHTLATATSPLTMSLLYIANAITAVALTANVWLNSRGLWIAVPAIYAGASISIACTLCHKSGAALNPLLGMTSVLMFAYSLCLTLVLM